MATVTTPNLRENKMGTMPVGKLLFSMALPLAISMLVQAFYNVVDSYYVARISESTVTALGMAFPIQNLMIGCATGVGVGMNALLSKSLGEGNHKRANQAAGNGLFLSLCFVVAFMIFGFVGARPFYQMQSQVAETIENGTAYVSICSIWCLGIFVEIIGERLLQGSGRTVYTLFTQGLGAVLNIVLDPVFIFGFAPLGIKPMGIAGAAVATVAGQWVAAIMALVFNFTSNPDVALRLKYLLPRKDIVKKILVVGVPSIIMMAIGSVMNFGMNQILLGFKDYGETPAGVFGIYFKLQSFVLMPLFGINNASISIIETGGRCGDGHYAGGCDGVSGVPRPAAGHLRAVRGFPVPWPQRPAGDQYSLPRGGGGYCPQRQLPGHGQRHLLHHHIPVPAADCAAPGCFPDEPDRGCACSVVVLPRCGSSEYDCFSDFLRPYLQAED